jgi:hypothetical protein
MTRSTWVVTLSVVLALGPAAEAPAGSGGCADTYPAMALGPFPEETSTPLFYAADSAGNGAFSVRWTGLSCGKNLRVSAEYGDQPGTAASPGDYVVPDGQRTPEVCESSTNSPGCPQQASISFPVTNDLAPESVTETLTIVLSNPLGGSIDPPSSAPFVLVDGDGATRVAFDELEYAGTENASKLGVAVWRAGPITSETQVPYEVRPATGAPATETDYAVTSPNPLVFAAGDRVEIITLDVVNDTIPEPTESLELVLGTPTGATPAMPGTKVLSIQDNEESASPSSRLHHPRNGRTYSAAAYQLREIHVFTHDAGGSGVVGADLALRRLIRGGRCEWYTGRRFRQGGCERPRWLPMQGSSAELFFRRIGELDPSVGTRISSYTAYSRAIDGAGNTERELVRGRNENTFEVKPKPR